MKRKKEERVLIKISVEVEEETWRRFKQTVLEKYGKLKGVLGQELTRALEHYMTLEQHAHAHKKHMHESKKSSDKLTKLIEYVSNFYEITHRDLEKYIAENIGFDKRTIEKYIAHLLLKNIITEKIKTKNNIVYTVNHDKINSFLKNQIP